uniref:Proline dehydrogenase n=1 Tax=Neobodo designis TaxID=312471 RepID=A0A7S1L203_NEODS|mmetsp:Transcript_129/g.476  ORF Transcript_129/g.476 Transcript_129/m.476 type:complete len:549 (+) Transcript_129:46-1692(+)
MLRRTAIARLDSVTFGADSTIFASRSVPELLRSMVVFRTCGLRIIVQNSRRLLQWSAACLGEHLTYEVLVRKTVFKQFCAGSDEKEIKPSLKVLQKQGVGPILDYAAEAPVDTTPSATEMTASALEVNLRKLLTAENITYAPDDFLDANVDRFIACLETTKDNMPPSGLGFAAVKITGLCDPQLLARVSAIMLRIRQTWAEFFIPANKGAAPQLEDCRDVCGRSKGVQTKRCDVDDFRAGVKRMCPGLAEDKVDAIVNFFEEDGTGYVHYFNYTRYLRNACVDQSYCPPELEPFYKSIPRLSKAETELSQKFDRRIKIIVDRAHKLGVRVMIDAEQSYYQTAIDAIVRDLQYKYNRDYPVVYNTYQAYLKFSYKRVSNDLARAKREGWIFAAKIVRGAYMETERKDAKDLGYESPVHDTKENTHAMYDQIGMRLLEEIENGNRIGVLFGTHNVQSLKLLTDRCVDIERKGAGDLDVAFAQLYGMGDHLTLPLAKAGFKAFKYVPYGPVKETVFYLQRRAEENSEMMTQSAGEWPLLKNELKRKLFRMK